jgi:hypothetical protein
MENFDFKVAVRRPMLYAVSARYRCETPYVICRIGTISLVRSASLILCRFCAYNGRHHFPHLARASHSLCLYGVQFCLPLITLNCMQMKIVSSCDIRSERLKNIMFSHLYQSSVRSTNLCGLKICSPTQNLVTESQLMKAS